MASGPSLYRPLDKEKREIRLLRLVEDGGDDLEELRFELQEFSLDSPPQYEGLSYRQGNDISQRSVRVNDQIYPPPSATEDSAAKQLPPNLYEYLRMIKTQKNLAWTFVDAICINQRDKEEVSSQIMLMGKIYKGAERVVAWMGVGDDATETLRRTPHDLTPNKGPLPFTWQDVDR